jgi:hypothetical protein
MICKGRQISGMRREHFLWRLQSGTLGVGGLRTNGKILGRKVQNFCSNASPGTRRVAGNLIFAREGMHRMSAGEEFFFSRTKNAFSIPRAEKKERFLASLGMAE